MKTDVLLKADVLDELEWEPSVNATGIGIAVKDGVVMLSGEVASYQEKLEAERAALRVEGVKGAANEIEIHPPGTGHRSDADIARAAVASLTWNSSVPAKLYPGRGPEGMGHVGGERGLEVSADGGRGCGASSDGRSRGHQPGRGEVAAHIRRHQDGHRAGFQA